jgi:hypothetical protein
MTFTFFTYMFGNQQVTFHIQWHPILIVYTHQTSVYEKDDHWLEIMVNLFITTREIASSFEFCARLQNYGFKKMMMLKMFIIFTKSGCHGVPMEMEYTHCYFLCEWDHHKMSSIRFVFLHDILLMVKQKMINKMGMDIKFYPIFISYL